MYHYQDLIELFDKTFYQRYRTRLVKGGDEPLYLPASDDQTDNQIIFAHGFFSSALHEIAHWCLAGSYRRTLEDFGYWYCPDGRDAEQQKAFEQVEIKPQAIEWAFNVAAGSTFNVSVDNLNGAEPNREAFEWAIYQQVQRYLIDGFPRDAQTFIQALAAHYQTPLPLTIDRFQPQYCQHKLPLEWGSREQQRYV
jgi:hypothetical protein